MRCWSPPSRTSVGRPASRAPPRWSPTSARRCRTPRSSPASSASRPWSAAVTATKVIRNGDRVRVDGAAGVVQECCGRRRAVTPRAPRATGRTGRGGGADAARRAAGPRRGDGPDDGGGGLRGGAGPGLARVPGADRAERGDVRPTGTALRVLLLRHAPGRERRLRPDGPVAGCCCGPARWSRAWTRRGCVAGRGGRDRDLARGPGRLAQALGLRLAGGEWARVGGGSVRAPWWPGRRPGASRRALRGTAEVGRRPTRLRVAVVGFTDPASVRVKDPAEPAGTGPAASGHLPPTGGRGRPWRRAGCVTASGRAG